MPWLKRVSLRSVVLGSISTIALAGCQVDQGGEGGLVMDPKVAGSASDTLAPLLQMDNPNRLPGRYIVRFKPRVADVRKLASAVAAERGGRVYQALTGLKGFWGELPDAAISALRRNPHILYIEADVAIPVAGVGDTTQSNPRWTLDRVDQRFLPLNNAYEYSVTGAGVHIWIIDTGVDGTEPELAGRIDFGTYVTNNGKDPFAPCYSHGTSVAVVAAGTIDGIAKGATIHVARVDENCNEPRPHYSSGFASFAFEFIGDYSPRPAVANFSGGQGCGFFGCGQTVDDAAKYARQKGVTVVVSAGNEGEDACDFSPAHTAELLTVGASDINDNRVVIPGYWSSNYGSCVDLFAPVENTGGTSAAAPMVTGVAALRLQAYPMSTPSQVEWEIISNSTQGVLGNIGSGSPNRLLFSKRPTLNADISGPSVIGPATTCAWVAVVSGGQSPFSYKWYRNGVVVSTTTRYTVRGNNTSFDLGLEVTDGVGRLSAEDKRVTVDPRSTSKLC